MKRFKVLLFFLTLLEPGSRLTAAIWYVNIAATGSNNGTSLTNAWTSISSAVAYQGTGSNGEPAAGDFVYIEPGTYNSGSAIQVEDSGSSGSPITLEKDPGAGAAPVIVGDPTGYVGNTIFEFYSPTSWVTLKNLTIEGSTGAGVSIQSAGTGVSVVDCIFQNFSGNGAYGVDANTFGSGTSLSQINISGNTFTNFNNSQGGFPAKVIALEGNISNSQVTDNTLTNDSAFYNGIDIDCDGGAPSHIIVSGNVINALTAEGGVNGCTVCYGAGIFLDGATYSTATANSLACTNGWAIQVGYTVDGPGGAAANYNVISNNIIFGSTLSAFNVGTFGAGSGSASYNSFLNNTLFENSTGSTDGEIAIWSGDAPSTKNVFENNVVWAGITPSPNIYITEGTGANAPTDTTFNYNDYWSNSLTSGAFVDNTSSAYVTLANWQGSSGENPGSPDPNSFSLNPDFTTTPASACGGVAADFIPQCSSPLVNAGENESAVPVDYVGVSRPISVHWTIGAYEVAPCGSTPTDTPSPTSSRTATPSPTLSPTPSPTSTLTSSATQSMTCTSTKTATPSATPTLSLTQTSTRTATLTSSASATVTSTPTTSDTPSSTLTATPTPSFSSTPSASDTRTPSPSATPSPSSSPSLTQTSTRTATPTSSASATLTSSPTTSDTPSSTLTVTPTPSFSSTPSASDTRTPSPSASASASLTPTYTLSPSASATLTFTDTPSETPSPTSTSTRTASPSLTASATQSSTLTPTSSSTASPTWSPSPTISQTPVPMPYQLNITIFNEAGELVRTLFNGESEGEPNPLSLSSGSLVSGSSSVGINLGVNNQVSGQGGLIWNGANDQGQSVSPGVYYIQLSFKDSFGRITTVTNSVQVLPGTSQSFVQIFNSAGELVYEENVSSTAQIEAISGPSTFSPPSSNTGGQNLQLEIKNSQGWLPWSWNGRDSQGQIVSSGNYLVTVSSATPNGDVRISKPITVIDGSLNFADPAPQISGNPLAKGSDLFVRYRAQSGNHAKGILFTFTGEKVEEVSDEGGTGTLDFGAEKAASGIYLIDFEYWQGTQLLERKILKLAIVK